MPSPLPKPPSRLGPFAREVLEFLAGHDEAAEIVIGGGIALAHYVDYRDTFDLDAWWAVAPTVPANKLLDGQRKVLSLQIAPRDRYLDATLEAAWPPVHIETLRDNVASKMTALVERGAPRDLRDIHELCRRDLVTDAECWRLYEQKNPGQAVHEAAAKVLHSLERLETLRPLHGIADDRQREEAAAVRRWYRDVFCAQRP